MLLRHKILLGITFVIGLIGLHVTSPHNLPECQGSEVARSCVD